MAIEELLAFLGWGDEPQVRRFFAEKMIPEKAHVGRWKVYLTTAERSYVEAEYEAILGRLRVEGVMLP